VVAEDGAVEGEGSHYPIPLRIPPQSTPPLPHALTQIKLRHRLITRRTIIFLSIIAIIIAIIIIVIVTTDIVVGGSVKMDGASTAEGSCSIVAEEGHAVARWFVAVGISGAIRGC